MFWQKLDLENVGNICKSYVQTILGIKIQRLPRQTGKGSSWKSNRAGKKITHMIDIFVHTVVHDHLWLTLLIAQFV